MLNSQFVPTFLSFKFDSSFHSFFFSYGKCLLTNLHSFKSLLPFEPSKEVFLIGSLAIRVFPPKQSFVNRMNPQPLST